MQQNLWAFVKNLLIARPECEHGHFEIPVLKPIQISRACAVISSLQSKINISSVFSLRTELFSRGRFLPANGVDGLDLA